MIGVIALMFVFSDLEDNASISLIGVKGERLSPRRYATFVYNYAFTEHFEGGRKCSRAVDRG